MISGILKTDTPHLKWFKAEQGRFLREARDKTKVSHEEASKHVGFDIREVESGKISLPVSKLIRLTELYGVPQDDFMIWQLTIGDKVRQMLAKS